MIVITDSNIIFSALITPNGTIAHILKAESKLQLFAPSYLFEEVDKHLSKIEELSPLDRKQIKAEIKTYKRLITIIETKDIPKKYYLEAYEIVIDIDFDDVFFVALNRYKHYKIWTLDNELKRGLEQKGYNICITTAEIKKSLYKK
ncbi:MAG TPA: PIN domain-containing protein [Chitinophagales bacterium]|nr:hypothetical protein [Chitinophagales bacterium]HMU97890.1 PIN domain-containing protein [Chitinophagales bacterium]HMV02730.1 PIN domain-containing protein [Chitinophagales bacterium]HMZ68548.1 PIN domain-containing protein [Chitinophagales bacterium]HNB38597.1 PIN domain-containing protein [Chitinophagales bacterium]